MTIVGPRRVRRTGVATVGALALAWAFAAAAEAGTIIVNTTVDNGSAPFVCSLREAVETANADIDATGCTDADPAAADVVALTGGEYGLSLSGALENSNVSGDLDVTETLTIQGAGAGATGIDGNRLITEDRVLQAIGTGTALTLTGLTVHDGFAIDGGGIAAFGTTLNLTNAVVSGNLANDDGGGFEAGTATLTNSTVTGNRANDDGGGFNADNASITGSTVSGNTAGGEGGGINGLSGGTVTLTNSTVSGNTANGDGGGVRSLSAATLSLINSTVSDNTAASVTGDGGGIVGDGVAAVTLNRTTVRRNVAGQNGGGIGIETQGDLVVSRSTIAGNDAVNLGGGVLYSPGSLADSFSLTNSTVSGNEAEIDGGGIRTDAGTANLANATISRNAAGGAGGGVAESGAAVVTARNTILAGNLGGGDCAGTIGSQGFNLFGGGFSGCTGGLTDFTGDPGLAPLADNGGPTPTHALQAGSAALNAGYPGSGPGGQPCEATDQRGQPRGGGAGQCDVGAFEAQPPPSPPAAPPAPPPVATPIVAAPTPLAPAKRCKKGQKLKKGKCVKRKRKRKRGA